MSVAALCQAVRNVLQTARPATSQTGALVPGWPGLSEALCDLALPQGKPPATAGELFVGVHAASWTTEPIEGLFEMIGVAVTISCRCTQAPYDRWAQAVIYGLPDQGGDSQTIRPQLPAPGFLLPQYPGIYCLADAIKTQIHLDINADLIINTANLLIDPNYGTAAQVLNGFVEPLRYYGGDSEPIERPGSWWDANASEAKAGLSFTMRFMGAARVQTIENME